MSTLAIRRYRLHVGGPAAQVTRSGPADLLKIGVGRDLSACVDLAGLLFPICPRAHQIAALRAAEQAVDLKLADGQAKARDILLLGEGVFSAVWRAALSWAKLVGKDVPAQAVQNARVGRETLAKALFEGPWALFGGAPMHVDQQTLLDAVSALQAAFEDVRALGEHTCGYADTFTLDALHTPPLHDSALATLSGCEDFEETPRILMGDDVAATSLAPWFVGQLTHAESLVTQLVQLSQQVKAAPAASVDAPITGSGVGIAMTVRGRLRHAMTLDEGIVTAWSAKAPTDWNFTNHGPAARAAAALKDASPEAAQTLIAAFDPCAPCEVVMERAHA